MSLLEIVFTAVWVVSGVISVAGFAYLANKARKGL
jgi:hypothetical protein